jgi:hypothetical protein
VLNNFSNYRPTKKYDLIVKGILQKNVEVLEKIPHKIHLKFVDGKTDWYTNEDLTAPPRTKSKSDTLKVLNALDVEKDGANSQKPTAILEVGLNKSNVKPPQLTITRMGNIPSKTEYEAIKQEYVDTPEFAFKRYKLAVRQIAKQKGWGELPKTCTLQETLDLLLKVPAIK